MKLGTIILKCALVGLLTTCAAVTTFGAGEAEWFWGADGSGSYSNDPGTRYDGSSLRPSIGTREYDAYHDFER